MILKTFHFSSNFFSSELNSTCSNLRHYCSTCRKKKKCWKLVGFSEFLQRNILFKFLYDWLTDTVGQETKDGPSKQQCAADGRIKVATYFQDLSNALLPLELVHCVQLHRNVWYEAEGMGRRASIWFKPTCWHVVAERSAWNCWSNSFERGKHCPSGWEVWGKQAQAWQDGIFKYLGGTMFTWQCVWGICVLI